MKREFEEEREEGSTLAVDNKLSTFAATRPGGQRTHHDCFGEAACHDLGIYS